VKTEQTIGNIEQKERKEQRFEFKNYLLILIKSKYVLNKLDIHYENIIY
jgi:hypothetical protein